MAEKPILFNDEMVRAILAGRKTQTRRPVKWPVMSRSDGSKQRIFIEGNAAEMNQLLRERQRHPLRQIKSPYAPGDLLYVRESYAPNYFGAGKHGYRADWTNEAADVVPEPKWTPSIHMRKQDARIWLRVTGVRVERVRDITDEDAIAEGAQRFEGLLPCSIRGTRDKWSMGSPGSHSQCLSTARNAFGNVWIAIYGPESWDRNDWVWVYEFERTEAPR